MCGPAAIVAGMSIVSTATTMVAQTQQANAQKKVIDEQSEIRGKQIQAQAGQQMSEAAMRAREARAASAAAASASNINLGSNSFMASLQTTTMNQGEEEGLITENEQNQQQANTAETESLLNSKASSPTFLGATLDTALSGAGAYMRGSAAYNTGVNTRRGDGFTGYTE